MFTPQQPIFTIIVNALDNQKVTITSENESAIALREAWLTRLGQIDSDSLFLTFLISSPNEQEHISLTSTSTKIRLKVAFEEINETFNILLNNMVKS